MSTLKRMKKVVVTVSSDRVLKVAKAIWYDKIRRPKRVIGCCPFKFSNYVVVGFIVCCSSHCM